MNLRRSLTTFFYMTKLILILPGIFVRYYFKRRKALGQFKRELIASGLSQQEAKELANVYPFKLGEVVMLARGFSGR